MSEGVEATAASTSMRIYLKLPRKIACLRFYVLVELLLLAPNPKACLKPGLLAK